MGNVEKWWGEDQDCRLNDFKPLKPDGVDYMSTNHLKHTGKTWATVVSGGCDCSECQAARLRHTVKKMLVDEKTTIKMHKAFDRIKIQAKNTAASMQPPDDSPQYP